MATPDIDTFIAANVTDKLPIRDLSPEALADAQKFRQAFVEGRAVRFNAMQKWFADRHNLQAGRRRLHTLFERAGVEPWWSP